MMLSWGCSDSSKDQKEGEAPSISEIEGEKQQDLSQEPKGGIPELTEEDKRLAAQAPEGMVFIKGSCFTMGNDEAQADEKYEHEVCLDSFYLDQYEVTQAEWEKVMGFNPSKIIKPDHPVEQVNYHDIQKFIKKSPRSCRLPTEAEWEYAARGGAVTGYFWGNVMDGTYAWFEDNSEGTTHPVGKKKPNAFGLYDMMGNVWEWTEDWYTPLYVGIKETNPTGPETGENKVIRGGSFNSSAGALRITNRTWLNPKNRVYSKISNYGGIVNEVFNYIGFRCAQSLSSPNTDEKPPADSGKEMPEQK
ncbi:MAG: SUMF1/EgtB/PvdO family nonheme iron enzyme [Nitrospinaceae bacterium]|nr:formylglycine-generating enzyme family protein [Nitrospinaceae bacterium]NIR56692.1 formylglycine-generating enzyme family protein [Nitrospinaceae bacterium]NIS87150.1 formylglycine-generating enzyme family protein [Nitrospinaceae bacterium]NIT84009.1 formylglycine-generating enzyme family protein [Nitrospinaceae bacterium]NIU46201.1 formylglycine-generating enzyme family protein [Nitrospinaceae bacterium]